MVTPATTRALVVVFAPRDLGAARLSAVLAGESQAIFGSVSATLPHIKAGKLRALAGWGTKRVEALPDLPTLKELGYDAEFYIWAGLFAPKATPEPVLTKLRETARAGLVSEVGFRAVG